MFGTRKLGRTSDQRKAMLRAMTTYLFENGKIETTVTRAKEVRAAHRGQDDAVLDLHIADLPWGQQGFQFFFHSVSPFHILRGHR